MENSLELIELHLVEIKLVLFSLKANYFVSINVRCM